MVLDFLDFSIFLTFHKIQNCRPHKTPNKPSLVLTWLLQFCVCLFFVFAFDPCCPQNKSACHCLSSLLQFRSSVAVVLMY